MSPHQMTKLVITNLIRMQRKWTLLSLEIVFIGSLEQLQSELISVLCITILKTRNINNNIFFGLVLDFLLWPIHIFNHLMLTLSYPQFMSFRASELLLLRHHYEQGENQTFRGYRKSWGGFVRNSSEKTIL